jgi:hypothetical protein
LGKDGKENYMLIKTFVFIVPMLMFHLFQTPIVRAETTDDSVITDLEGLLGKEQSSQERLSDLEQWVMYKKPNLRMRIATFLRKHKVKRPDFYASIIIKHPMPDRQKKMMASIIVPESRGNANAVSPVGATGTWQVMPAWKKILKIKGNLKDPLVNLYAAVRVYNIHAKDAGYDEHKTLVYYSGRTPGYADKVQNLMASI